MSKTEEGLKTAFAGESQANRKYIAFAEKADKEGFPQIAKIFRAAAAAETIHALNHLKVLGGVKSTKENLQAAVEGEHYEFTKMYPEFINSAKEEGNEDAERTFNYANKAERIHHKLYTVALEAVDSGKDLNKEDVYVCPVCGYTHEGTPPEKCPICNTAKKLFRKID